jgi:hypothetical protein
MLLSFPRIGVCVAGGAMLLTIGAADAPKAAEPQADKDGFVQLFDGKSLDGWKVGDKAAAWSVKDGQIVVNNGPSHLFYDGPVHNHDWKNFDLKAEVMTLPHANSGIYFHTTYQEKGWPDDGFESQVNCTHSDWKKTGSLYDVQDIRDPHHKDNEWFLYEVIVKGDHVTLKINGEVVNDWTQPADFKPPKGHKGRYLHHGTFALQGHDPKSETHFKSIEVKPLDD